MLIRLDTGLVVIGLDTQSEGYGFESQHSILDGYFSHIIVVNRLQVSIKSF